MDRLQTISPYINGTVFMHATISTPRQSLVTAHQYTFISAHHQISLFGEGQRRRMLSISPPRFARPTSTMNAIGGNRRGTKPRRVSCPSGVHLGNVTGSTANNNSLRPPSFQSGTHRTRSSTISATSAMDCKDVAEDEGRGDTWWCGCSSETAETMASNLPYEIHNFNRNVRYMRRLVKDTQQTLTDIRESGSFYRDQLSTANVNADQLIDIGRSLEKRPCFIVHGQNCFAKSIVVNELLGKQILPPATLIASTTTAHEHDAAESMSTSSEAMAAAAVSEGETHVGWRMVRFRHGTSNQISLSLPDSYELMEHLQAFEQPAWRTVPRADLELQDSVGRKVDPAKENAVLDIRLSHPLLKEEAELIVTSSTTFNKHQSQLQQQQLANDDAKRTCALSAVFAACSDVHMLPILIYAISEETLSEAEQEDLKVTRSLHPDVPVFFICVRQPPSTDLTESEQHAQSERQKQSRKMIHQHTRQFKRIQTVPEGALDLFQQLCDLGFLNLVPSDWSKRPRRHSEGTAVVTSELVENFDYFPSVLFFVRQIVQSCLVSAASVLHQVHNTCLKMFINAAFDMARDLLITPKRIDYAKKKESELYEALLEIANEKQEEIKNLIVETIDGTKEELVRRAADYEFRGVTLASDGVVSSARELRICTSEIQDLVLGSLNSSVAVKLIGSVECLRESVVGTLERCLESLEKIFQEGGDSPQASNALKHVRRTQRINQRLDTRTDLTSSSTTRFCHLNFQQILTAAYQVEVTVKTSSSLMRVFWEKMKQLIQTMPGKTPPHIDSEWKQKVASDMIDSLSEWRLAKSICSQFRERLKHAHEAFASSLRQLEAHHSGRLEKTEEQRLKVRKIYAPKIARYALESTSLRDFVLHGMPQLGREIGRGQYGVVFSCESWGHQSPCALKSVVPPDEKHWNDLALEFHYTRSVPEHDRIVTYIGSVIDHSYAGGSTPAVILIMERLQRDLYSAIRSGLDWLVRLQIAVDVIQGIRFLHSQGLVHRDIKLKNVLLDKRNRAKLTDLGFCKPEAMMSGSIVGTPIHMAPELFCGKYDHRVDVYAFGILFWYICAGHVRLPYIYEQCQNKDQLWNDVKRGVRPERLPQFDDKCWAIMEECWATEKDRRPLLGEVELRLNSIINYYRRHPAPKYDFRQREVGLLSSSPYIDIDF